MPGKAQQAQREQAGKSQQATPCTRTSEQSPQQQTAALRKGVAQRRMTQEEVSALLTPHCVMWAAFPSAECCLLQAPSADPCEWGAPSVAHP